MADQRVRGQDGAEEGAARLAELLRVSGSPDRVAVCLRFVSECVCVCGGVWARIPCQGVCGGQLELLQQNDVCVEREQQPEHVDSAQVKDGMHAARVVGPADGLEEVPGRDAEGRACV